MKIGDIVVITTETPCGIFRNVKNEIGIISDYYDEDNYYEIRTGIYSGAPCFVYSEDEFRLATDEECREALAKFFNR